MKSTLKSMETSTGVNPKTGERKEGEDLAPREEMFVKRREKTVLLQSSEMFVEQADESQSLGRS